MTSNVTQVVKMVICDRHVSLPINSLYCCKHYFQAFINFSVSISLVTLASGIQFKYMHTMCYCTTVLTSGNARPVEMFLDATHVTVYHNTVLPSCSTPDVSGPSQVSVALTQSVHNPDSKRITPS